MKSGEESTRLWTPRASAETAKFVDDACDRFEEAWKSGDARLEDFLDGAPEDCREHLLRELASIELHYRRDAEGNRLTREAFIDAHPQIRAELAVAFDHDRGLDGASSTSLLTAPAGPPASHETGGSRELHIRCPHCREPVELLADTPLEDISCRGCGSTFSIVDRDASPAAAPSLQAIDRFELLSRVGVGGFGTVWKARDTELDRIVALKIPRRGNLGPDEIEHFFREARAAAQLQHPNIVPVHEIGRAGDTVFIVSDFIRGAALSKWMQETPPTVREIAELGATVADALHHAHTQGVIHRDLKPSNVMIDDAGRPFLMDFGLAKRQVGEITMTFDGQILGTAAYMSPEQAGGKGHWTDCRTDVYSLGVMLFQMATGELPIRGNFEVQIVHKQIDDAPDPRKLNPRLPRDLATIILKCLERDPNGRYASAAAVGQELRRFLRGEPIRARPLSAGRRVARWALRKPALATALALTMILAVAGPVAAVVFFRQRALIDRKYREGLEIIQLEQRQRQELLDENLALEARIDALLGQAPGIERIAPDWKRNLAAQVVDAHYVDAPLQIDLTEDLRDQARRALAMGYLYAELDPPTSAVAPLQEAKRALEKLSRESPGDQGVVAALADCLSLIAKHAENDALAKTSLEQLVALRENSVRDDPRAASAIDHFDAHWQALDADDLPEDAVTRLDQLVAAGKEIVKNWPADPAEAYEAACRLTLREAALSNQKP